MPVTQRTNRCSLVSSPCGTSSFGTHCFGASKKNDEGRCVKAKRFFGFLRQSTRRSAYHRDGEFWGRLWVSVHETVSSSGSKFFDDRSQIIPFVSLFDEMDNFNQTERNHRYLMPGQCTGPFGQMLGTVVVRHRAGCLYEYLRFFVRSYHL